MHSMTFVTTILALVVLSGGAAPVFGQADATADHPTSRQEILVAKRKAKAEQLEPERVSKWEARILSLEERRFPSNIFAKGWHKLRPLIGGMPPGSGFVFGGGFVHGLTSETFQLTVNARRSTRGYTTLDTEATFPTALSRAPVHAYVRAGYRDLTSLRFYGLGPDSAADDRSFYKQEDQTVAAGIRLTPHRRLELGADVGLLSLDISSSPQSPSVDTMFGPASLPGFREQPDFVTLGGHVEVRLLDRGLPPAGLIARVEASRYDDRDTDAYDFTRVVADVQGHVPLGYRNRRLALRLRTSHATADSGQSVPFYLMETLGGSTTIRGFRQYRFRDTRNVLVNAEYRWEVWTYADLALFVDAGKVFSDASDFGLSKLRTGYGIGLRAHAPTGMVLRFDLARSAEGLKFHIGSGPRF